MGSPFPANSTVTEVNESSTPARSTPRPRIRKRRHMRPAARYGMIAVVLIIVAIVAQFIVHAVRADPRDAHTIAERELELNTLQTGEHAIRTVSVFQRPAIDYFRATRGILVLTNRRLLYLGLEPRDLLAAPDMPPTFVERDFPIDTLVQVTAGRTFFGFAKAVVIATPNETLRLGVPSAAWPRANVLIVDMDVRHAKAVQASVTQRQFLAKAAAERQAADAARRKPKYYTVRRGDALGSIATIWNTTPDKLRTWNHLPNNNIRVGQVLMVKPAT